MNCKCGSVRWDLIRAAVTWAGLCVRACVFVCVRVCDEENHGCSRCLFLKWTAKRDPLVTSNFVSVNCKCRSVSCDVFRAAVMWLGDACARVSFCMGICLCVGCHFGY